MTENHRHDRQNWNRHDKQKTRIQTELKQRKLKLQYWHYRQTKTDNRKTENIHNRQNWHTDITKKLKYRPNRQK